MLNKKILHCETVAISTWPQRIPTERSDILTARLQVAALGSIAEIGTQHLGHFGS
jgi:hypothetical protein